MFDEQTESASTSPETDKTASPGVTRRDHHPRF